MKIRNFRLINGDGVGYDLTTRSHFLHTPSGLGFQKDMTYQRLGNLYVVLDDAYAQGQIMGNVFFPNPNAYEKYYEFIRFCQNTPIRLLYKPSTKEYRRDVVLSSVAKEELSAGGLDVAVVFDCLSLFYEHFSLFGDKEDAETGKTYDYRYGYKYADSSTNSLLIDSDSYADSPCTIYIFGEAVNPVWRHYVDNVLVATGKLNATIENGQKLRIDTTQIPYSITRVDMSNRLIGDVYAYGDFSTERFIMLKHGKNTISVSHDAVAALSVSMEAQIVYASV